MDKCVSKIILKLLLEMCEVDTMFDASAILPITYLIVYFICLILSVGLTNMAW